MRADSYMMIERSKTCRKVLLIVGMSFLRPPRSDAEGQRGTTTHDLSLKTIYRGSRRAPPFDAFRPRQKSFHLAESDYVRTRLTQ